MPEITGRIQIARSFGDLSENSEYQSAKDEQAFVEGRINTLQNMLDNAVIIDSSEIADDEVSVGKKVTFKSCQTKSLKLTPSLVPLKQTHLRVRFQTNHHRRCLDG